MDIKNKDKIIVKNSLRSDSTGEVSVGKVIGLFALSFGLVLSVVLVIMGNWAMIVGVLVCGVFFGYFMVCIIRGRVIAVISDEGLALATISFKVISWENIRGYMRRRGRRGRSSNSVDVRFIDTIGNTQEVSFDVSFANYTVEEVIAIMDKFSDRHKSGHS